MSGWRVARSLDVLEAEIDASFPGRSTAHDGSIGDQRHAATDSDHNPNDQNVVCARDFTHDPAAGADMHACSRRIVAVLPPALKYVIWNKQIWSHARASEGWRPYRRSNPHTKHMHVSVGRGPDGHSTGPYDDTSSWGIAAGAFGPIGDDVIGLERGDGMGDRSHLRQNVKGLQAVLRYAGFDPGDVDGKYGDDTAGMVLAARRSVGSGAEDGDRITGWAWAQILLALIRAQGTAEPGPPGEPGPAGPPGEDGRDGVLQLPVGVTITGRITAAEGAQSSV